MKFSTNSLTYSKRVKFLLLPYIVGIVGLVILPGILSFGLAFFHYNALSPPTWAGKLNFILVYTDELFLLSVQNSISIVLLSVPLRVFGAFFLARLMQKQGKFLNWFRASIYLPSIIPAPAHAFAWLWILNPLFGPLRFLLDSLGFVPPGWFADPLWSKPGLILMSLWQIGEGFLVCLAVLLDIPQEVEDAAQIDGANFAQIFWLVILPIMSPVLLLLSFRDVILSIQESLSTVLLTTGGGPYYSTYVLPLFVYEQGFDLLSFGTASAAMWILYLLTALVVLALYFFFGQRGEHLIDEIYFS